MRVGTLGALWRVEDGRRGITINGGRWRVGGGMGLRHT